MILCVCVCVCACEDHVILCIRSPYLMLFHFCSLLFDCYFGRRGIILEYMVSIIMYGYWRGRE